MTKSNNSKKKILITGGLGYIGSHIVNQLEKSDYEIVVYDNCSNSFPASLRYGKLVIGDLGHMDRLRQVFLENQFDSVIHLAASTLVSESVFKPLNYYENNTSNTLNLLKCCEEFDVKKFIFSSTAAVYGEPQENPVNELAPTKPLNPYGQSKLMSEWMIQRYSQSSNLRYVILRYFNAAGANPDGLVGQAWPKAPLLINIACEAALGLRSEVHIFGTDFPTPDGTGIRDYVHVADIASAHRDALKYLEREGESQTFNCGYGQGFSVWEVIKEVKSISQTDFPVIKSNRRQGDPACVIACSKRIKDVLGWQPKHKKLNTIVSTALTWKKQLLKDQLPLTIQG